MKFRKTSCCVACLWTINALVAACVLNAEPQNQARVRENINTLRLLRMTQALDLTEDQTAKIYPLANRIEKEKMEINKKIGEEIKTLRSLLKEEPPKMEEISGRVKSVKTLRKEMRAKDEEFENFLDENLTEIQKAKCVLFSVDFFRGLGDKLERARRMTNRAIPKEKREY